MVESLREIVQDLLVPELKAMKVSTEVLRQDIRLRDEMMLQSIMNLSEKPEYTGEIRERLEARLPRQ